MDEPQSTTGLVYASADGADAFARSLLEAHGVPPQDAAQYRAFVDALEGEDAAAAEEAAAWLRGRLSREGTALAAALAEGGPA